MFDLNPKDVLNQRKLGFMPPHFSKIKIADNEFFDGVEEWVKTKLKGRYCIVRYPNLDQNSSLRSSYCLGLEDQKELTFFMLACPHLRRN